MFYDFYRKGKFRLLKKVISIPLLFMAWGTGLVYGYK